ITAGDDLVLYVATDAPAFRVVLVRFGHEPVVAARSGWFEGVAVGVHLQHQDWSQPNPGLDGTVVAGWPAYRLPTRPEWRPGIYVAVLVEGDGDGHDARSARPGSAPAAAVVGAHSSTGPRSARREPVPELDARSDRA